MPETTIPLKMTIEVVAGLVPGTPMEEFTRRWYWTSSDQQALADGPEVNEEAFNAAHTKWIQISGESREYAATLEDPRKINWVRRDWLWL